MKLEFSQQILGDFWNIKYHENPSSKSWVVLCGQTSRQTDMIKLIVTLYNFVNTPEGTIEKKVIAELNEFNYLGCSVS
jgi:hypothetical protein